MARTFLLLLKICICLSLLGQKEYNNWYFGKHGAINFNTQPPEVKDDTNMMSATFASASISDKTTGELLFYTTGLYVSNKKHKLMENGYLNTNFFTTDVMVVPFPENSNKYYVFGNVLKGKRGAILYSEIDMTLQDGLGEVTKRNGLLNSQDGGVLFAVKHAFEKAYWVVAHKGIGVNSIFHSHKINKDRVDTSAVTSTLPVYPSVVRVGEITTSSDGGLIAASYYDSFTSGVNVYEFDKLCGKVSSPLVLHVEPDWMFAQGICFSPDDSKLYATVSSKKDINHPKSYIIQYYGQNFSQWQIIAESKQAYNGLRLGPDNKIYISINDSLKPVPSSRVDALIFPNNLGKDVGYTPKYLDLGYYFDFGFNPARKRRRTTNYRFPNLIYDKSPFGSSKNNKIIAQNICLGDSTHFSLTTTQMFDSVYWELEKGLPIVKTNNASYIYGDTGSYTITATQFFCNQSWDVSKNIKIVKSPSINWPTDSVFCYNGELKLSTPFNTGNFTWSTGETTSTISAEKEGLYWVDVVLGSCQATDSIYVTELPPILIDLGGDYTVCEHDTDDLVKLDAGKNYKHYKWTPTQDTTQWIIVKQAGDYYVVVEDFRGCKGDDGSKVARLCNFDFHIPNAFTPNGDGLNDVFKATTSDIYKLNFEIYNTWGERVFKTNNPQQGWDGNYKGKPCPNGAYLYKVSFNGFSNKQLKTYNFKGNVSLLR